MRIQYFENKKTFTSKATGLMIQEIDRKPNLLMCTATGNSPLPVYRNLVKDFKLNPERYAKLRILKLDEWAGLANMFGSCEAYLQKELINPLKIAKTNYFAFDAETKDPEGECSRIKNQLNNEGPIGLCVLGLGKNGHLGFNEPPASADQKCHVARLTPSSQNHGMVATHTEKPSYGMTLGIQEILNSKRILLLISGEGKENVKKQFLSKKVDPECPATFLWLHPNVDCFILEN
ncbi:galactosamine-6-phosphate isomerase [Flagellimonas sp. 2504JD1-5]